METTMTQFDTRKSEDFAEKLLSIINGGPLSLMISIGHRTGLFDTLGDLGRADLSIIAKKAGLNKRYIKEWLGAMVTGRIIEYDSRNKTYFLPTEHQAWLTRKAGSNNMAVFGQYTSVLGGVEDEIVKCFENGGGVPYEKFHRFHEVMAEDSGLSVGTALFEHILPLEPGLIQKLEHGITVLDIGCGSGRTINIMAEAFPKSSFTGIDLCEEPILKARSDSNNMGNTNTWFETADLTHYESDNQYDLITAFDAIHDQARPDKVLKTIFKSLKNDGVFVMQDIYGHSHLEKNMEHPLASMLYAISTMHCMTVSLAQNGMGLGTMWGVDTAKKMLKQAGFNNVKLHRLKHDIQNVYFIVKK